MRIIEVEDPESAIVFCNTKDETERLAELQNAGFDADWLNGDLAQGEREKVMAPRARASCASSWRPTSRRAASTSRTSRTSSTSTSPDATEQYVHRTGRTGRAGRTGTAISLVTPKDKI
jgi:ATP-dependent RNA helicase DeaD